MGGNSDWLLWWGTFQRVPGARLHVWRCSPSGLNVGEALLVMTVEDAQRMRLDDHATALAYLTGRFGPGRFRLTPRSDQGTKLPGTQSLVAVIDEENTAMQVTMHPVANVPTATPSTAVDRETANPSGSVTAPPPASPVTMVERRPAIAVPRPRPAIAAVPATPVPSRQSDPVGDSLRQVRAIHRSGQSEDDPALRQVIAGLPPALTQAIRAGDVASIQREVMPAVQVDPTLGEWLSQQGVGDWLTSYLQRLRVELTDGVNAPIAVVSPTFPPQAADDDLIV